jgi:hypothetical protein
MNVNWETTCSPYTIYEGVDFLVEKYVSKILKECALVKFYNPIFTTVN